MRYCAYIIFGFEGYYISHIVIGSNQVNSKINFTVAGRFDSFMDFFVNPDVLGEEDGVILIQTNYKKKQEQYLLVPETHPFFNFYLLVIDRSWDSPEYHSAKDIVRIELKKIRDSILGREL